MPSIEKKMVNSCDHLLFCNKDLTFTTLLANSADNKLMMFCLLSPETGFSVSFRLSPLESFHMKYQYLLSGKRKKFEMLSAENFTQRAKC